MNVSYLSFNFVLRHWSQSVGLNCDKHIKLVLVWLEIEIFFFSQIDDKLFYHYLVKASHNWIEWKWPPQCMQKATVCQGFMELPKHVYAQLCICIRVCASVCIHVCVCWMFALIYVLCLSQSNAFMDSQSQVFSICEFNLHGRHMCSIARTPKESHSIYTNVQLHAHMLCYHTQTPQTNIGMYLSLDTMPWSKNK